MGTRPVFRPPDQKSEGFDIPAKRKMRRAAKASATVGAKAKREAIVGGVLCTLQSGS